MKVAFRLNNVFPGTIVTLHGRSLFMCTISPKKDDQ